MTINVRNAAIDRLVALNYNKETAPHIVDTVIEVFNEYAPQDIGAIIIINGSIKIDMAMQRVYVNNAPVVMTTRQYRVMEYLIKAAGNVKSHKQIGIDIWGIRDYSMDFASNIRVVVGELRQLIGPDIIKTKQGVGYYIERE